MAFKALPTLVVARAVFTALLEVSIIPRAVPDTGNKPKSCHYSASGLFPDLRETLAYVAFPSSSLH